MRHVMTEHASSLDTGGQNSGRALSEAGHHAPEPGVPTRRDLSICALQTSYPGIVCSVCLSDCELCLEEIARWGA
jgi:hypothetical protein